MGAIYLLMRDGDELNRHEIQLPTVGPRPPRVATTLSTATHPIQVAVLIIMAAGERRARSTSRLPPCIRDTGLGTVIPKLTDDTSGTPSLSTQTAHCTILVDLAIGLFAAGLSATFEVV